MQVIQLIHNPGAGNGRHSKEELVNILEKAGYECRYISTKKDGWKKFKLKKVDLLLIAGGDGTFRKVCKNLLEKDYGEYPLPIAFFPIGTANNLGKTLQVEMDFNSFVQSLDCARTLNFGMGNLKHVPGESFFMESFGYGIFPFLMKQSGKIKSSSNDPDDEIRAALKLLDELIPGYEPVCCTLRIDGKDYSGEYIMAEIMNIKSIGPNLFISPNADPSDGVFEVVLVSSAEKENFSNYIHRTLAGEKATFEFIEVSGKDIEISWDGDHAHTDDILVKLKKNTPISISVSQSVFRLLLPEGRMVDGR